MPIVTQCFGSTRGDNMPAIELTYDQIDAIVVASLQESYVLESKPNRDEGGNLMDVDTGLQDSIKMLLQYYMPMREYTAWTLSVTKEQQNKA